MTTTELEAGRELDALVAEKVMGWRRKTYWACNEETVGLFPPNGPFDEHDQYPEYSIDMNAALLVMEQVRSLGWWPTLDYLKYWDNVSYWFATFRNVNENGYLDNHDASPAVAICRAAIKVVDFIALAPKAGGA